MNPSRVRPLPKFPAVERDIAVILTVNIPAAKLIMVTGETIPTELQENIRIFDEFQSKEMKAASERSLGIRITLRSPERTLEDEEADKIVSRVIETLENKLSARLRT
jgi:phenylalanyl-tRNA synthetase beta chain